MKRLHVSFAVSDLATSVDFAPAPTPRTMAELAKACL
jgi:hypothetical protein